MATKQKKTQVKSIGQFDDTPEGRQEYWSAELTAAKKSFSKWHERGERIIKKYIDKRTDNDIKQSKFNLFNANTGILQASLYAQVPKPDVSRRFKDPDDQVGRVAGMILQRTLQYELETDSYFDTIAKNTIWDMLVPGMGATWVRYDVEESPADVGQLTEIVEDSEVAEDAELDPVITDEQTPIDYIHWKDLFFSPARTWDEVRWVGRRVYMGEQAIIDRFGEDVAKGISIALQEDDERDTTSFVKPEEETQEQAEIYEIWDKETKKVYFFSFDYPEILDEKDDPYQLPGFFPTSQPLVANITTNDFMPTPDYTLCQDQYSMLNELEQRISQLLKAAKITGVYDSKQAGIKNLLQTASENTLIPVDNWAIFSEQGGISGSVQFMPIEQVTSLLNELNSARDVIKAQIYELTGISDILRGVGQAYATATQDQIKSHYASLRLAQKQTAVAEYFTRIIQLKAHLICKFYEPQRILERCGVLPAIDQQYIGPALQLLKNVGIAHFKLEISTDSLQLQDWDADKAQRAQLLTSVSQFLGTAIPAVEKTPQLAPLMGQALMLGVAGFKGAEALEGEINTVLMQLQKVAAAPPPPPPPDPEQQKVQLEQQRMQQDMQMQQAKAQADAQSKQQQAQIDAQKQQFEMEMAKQKMLHDQQIELRQTAIEERKLALAEQTFQLQLAQAESEKMVNETDALLRAQQASNEINNISTP